MKIYKPRGITRGQIVLVTILGFFGGVYIWRPLLEQHYPRKQKELNSDIDNSASQ